MKEFGVVQVDQSNSYTTEGEGAESKKGFSGFD